MTHSAFVSRGGSKPGSGSPTSYGAVLEFTLMVVRDAGKRPGSLAGLTARRVLHGLLRWETDTYEGQVPMIGALTLSEGIYLLDGGPRRPGGGGGGRGERSGAKGGPAPTGPDFSIPLRPQQGGGGDGLTLHGPGAGPGSIGIMLLADDAAAFWQRWQATGRSARPPRLRVVHAAAVAGEGGKRPGGGHGGGPGDGKNPFRLFG